MIDKLDENEIDGFKGIYDKIIKQALARNPPVKKYRIPLETLMELRHLSYQRLYLYYKKEFTFCNRCDSGCI